jgi:hypothetical protein
VLLVVGCLISVTGAQDFHAARRAYLHSTIGLSSTDIRRIEAGRPVVVTLDGRDGPEVVTFGGIHIGARPAAVLDHVFSLDTLRRTVGALAVGTISVPPQLSDFSGLTVIEEDLSSLARCRPGACDVQLPGWAIQRLRDGIPFRSPAAQGTADRLMREVAHRLVSTYVTGGQTALDPYRDRSQPLRAHEEYERLLHAREYLPAPFTPLRDYLRAYPAAVLAGARERFFWATIEAHLKPTTRLSHMVAAPADTLGPSPFPIAGVVATTQIFASHYYSSTLEWHVVVPDPAGPDGAYVFFLTRSWTPGMTGFRAPITRPAVRNRVRESLVRYLTLTKSLLEAR